MAEEQDKESKTEEASEKKMRDALEHGNVPISREFATLASLVAILIATMYFFSTNVIRLKDSLARFIDNPGDWPLETSTDAVSIFLAIGTDLVPLLLPAILLMMLAGIGSSLIQTPLQIVAERIQPKWSNISLKKGWNRLFGMQGLVNFLKSLFKLAAVTVVGILVLKAMQSEVLSAMFMEPTALPELIRKVAARIVGWVALLTLALVVGDIIWAHIHWRQELRMTKQEVKDEHKQMEGDPLVKARLRSLARDRARKRMMTAVPRATLVIANPTHFAVALRYVREEGGAPVVLAKGVDLIALKIREIAESNNIPIVEDKPLARSLYESVDVGKLIPPQFYKAVAEIIYYLHLRKKR
jgi:flagellar biosynthesis protein FlhB